MLIQTAQDPRLAESVFRCVQNANTRSGTITAGSIAINSPVVLETATASLPSSATDGTPQNFVRRPATITSLVNNLMVGIIARVPGTKAYLDREEVGLAQCYGPHIAGVVQRATAGASVGSLLSPDSIQALVAVGGPVTAAATSTAGHVEVPAIGGLAVLMEALATSASTELTTARIFLRCM